MKKKINIVNARPQFVKYLPISKSIELSDSDLRDALVYTGQHYDSNMSKVSFYETGIKRPDHNLGVGSGSPDKRTVQVREGLKSIFRGALCPELRFRIFSDNSHWFL